MSNLSRYPDGSTGLALLLIRLSSAMVVFPTLARVPVAWTLESLPWFISMAMVGALLGGLGMRSAAMLLIVFLLAAMSNAEGDAALLLSGPLGGAIALALLGPGANSIEAHLFGRRVIRLGGRPSDGGSE